MVGWRRRRSGGAGRARDGQRQVRFSTSPNQSLPFPPLSVCFNGSHYGGNGREGKGHQPSYKRGGAHAPSPPPSLLLSRSLPFSFLSAVHRRQEQQPLQSAAIRRQSATIPRRSGEESSGGLVKHSNRPVNLCLSFPLSFSLCAVLRPARLQTDPGLSIGSEGSGGNIPTKLGTFPFSFIRSLSYSLPLSLIRGKLESDPVHRQTERGSTGTVAREMIWVMRY